METWRILAMIGVSILYIGIMSFIFIMQKRHNKVIKEFWNTYFDLIEARSKQINKDIELGKIKVEFHNGKMYLIDGGKENK
jgi:hypothetical protein